MTLTETRIPDDLGDPRIEHRFWGLDRRLILPTLGILALVIFWTAFIPWLDESTQGDALESGVPIEMAGGVEFTPADGWNSDGAIFPGTTSLTIFKGDVTFRIQPGAWSGTADELLDEIIDRADPLVKGDRLAATLPSGLEAVGIDTYTDDEEGFLLALVSDEQYDPTAGDRVTGIGIDANSAFDYSQQDQDDVAEMIASIRVVPVDERNPATEEDGE